MADLPPKQTRKTVGRALSHLISLGLTYRLKNGRSKRGASEYKVTCPTTDVLERARERIKGLKLKQVEKELKRHKTQKTSCRWEPETKKEALRRLCELDSQEDKELMLETYRNDFILVFDKVTPAIKKKISDIVAEMLCEWGMVITAFVFTEDELEMKKYEPFVMNAEKEGILL